MRYIGSKTSSLPRLSAILSQVSEPGAVLCDPFAGTCTVARHFKAEGFSVITGDRLHASFVLQKTYVRLRKAPRFSKVMQRLKLDPTDYGCASLAVLAYLNALDGQDGYITRTYSVAGPEARKFFSVQNARRIDAIRRRIRRWWSCGLINVAERAYLMTALIEACDRVANTAGTYYAYLKVFSRKARKPIVLQSPMVTSSLATHRCYRSDALTTVKRRSFDVLYLDPPYNTREYGHYYHLPETLAKGEQPRVRGKSGIPIWRIKPSRFCQPRNAVSALSGLLSAASCKVILLHYAVNGLVSHQEILRLLREKGRTECRTWYVRRYSTNSHQRARCLNRLYLCWPD